MKFSIATVLSALVASVAGVPAPELQERNSPSWAGTNLYYLHGLSDQQQDAYIADLVKYNAKVIRLWVNGLSNGSCQKGSKIVREIPPLESQLGVYNNASLNELDKVLVKLQRNNIKAIISPHDANSLLGDNRKDCYWQKWGAGYFYEQDDAFKAYDARLSYILNYKGATSGKVWKNWPEAIFSFNLQNEPMTPSASHCSNNDPHGWFCGRATHLRSELGANSPILISTGGAGGDYSHGCTFLSAITSCPAVDAISIHRYASVPGNWKGSTGGWISQAKGKKVFVEEWGIDATKYARNSAFPSEVRDMNAAGLPGLYWQLLPPVSGGCSYDPKNDEGDHFGIFTEGSVDLASPIKEASSSTAAQDWTGSVY